MKHYAKALKILHEIEEMAEEWEEETLDGEECMEEIHALINDFFYPREEPK